MRRSIGIIRKNLEDSGIVPRHTMKPAQHPTSLRIQDALHAAGVETQVVEFEQTTRTSAEAAAAIGCSVAEIAKSVVFRMKASNRAAVVITSGDNRVSEEKVAAIVGDKLGRADAEFVREATGFAIGGVSPIGYAKPVTLLLDQDLQRFAEVWAAAGTPFSVFPLPPHELARITGAPWCDVRVEP